MSGETDELLPEDVPPKIDIVLCIDPEVVRRFRATLRHMCVGLVDAAVQARLLTCSPEAEALALGPIQHIFYREPSWLFRRHRLRELWESLEGRLPHIVHAFSWRSYDLAAELARRAEAHLVLHVLGRADVDALAGWQGHRVSHVMAGSRPLFEAVLRSAPVRSEQVSLVRPGIIPRGGPTCFAQAERNPTLLCTCRLVPERGVNRLIEALRLLRRGGHDFLAFLTGSGPMDGELRRTVRQTGLAPVVTLAEPVGEATQIMIGADIYVRPAIQEAISIRALQAMGVGMGCVTVRGGVDDAHLDETTGLVCPDGEPATLAAAIARLLSDRSFARGLGSRAADHVKQHHSASAMCAAQVGVYQHLVLRDRTFSIDPDRPTKEGPGPAPP